MQNMTFESLISVLNCRNINVITLVSREHLKGFSFPFILLHVFDQKNIYVSCVPNTISTIKNKVMPKRNTKGCIQKILSDPFPLKAKSTRFFYTKRSQKIRIYIQKIGFLI